MDRNTKKEVIESLKEIFSINSVVLVVKNLGIKVSNARTLRRTIKKADCSYLVTKNSLAKLAASGTKFEKLTDLLSGPTALAYSSDPVAIAKIIADFAKSNDKMEILGGVFNEKFLSANEVKHLATLPSLDELRGTIVGLLNAPATRLATVLQAPAADLARVFDAYSKK